jgi:hypothetical protein
MICELFFGPLTTTGIAVVEIMTPSHIGYVYNRVQLL